MGAPRGDKKASRKRTSGRLEGKRGESRTGSEAFLPDDSTSARKTFRMMVMLAVDAVHDEIFQSRRGGLY
ncbi:hypothetical protein HMPREF9080_00060 [Cardiobacterium valvarum F0432]|uniref:Uncharacterized protein n=1 Tax=Cardiobacterium valvarum F0432 TaxID=797473 RepID=G9ZBD7_9GAMM|nr:hypothetical protein HMPREF9080_00060 [Cardiobacterium valvarum F0432]